MAKQRPSVQKRQREFDKRQRAMRKAEKAARKREGRTGEEPVDDSGVVLSALPGEETDAASAEADAAASGPARAD